MVPGNANGSLDGIALKPLTVAFHEPGFIARLQVENQQPFWFMMSAEQRQRAGNPMGPANPQALNRYAYTQNNPLKYTDPSGHTAYLTNADARALVGALNQLATNIAAGVVAGTGVVDILRSASGMGAAGLSATSQVFFKAIAASLAEVGAAGSIVGIGLGVALSGSVAHALTTLATEIDAKNGANGVALAVSDGSLLIADRENGRVSSWTPGLSPGAHLVFSQLPDSWQLGAGTIGDPNWIRSHHFAEDERRTYLPTTQS